MPQLLPGLQQHLQRGVVIPACPLALNQKRRLDEQRQRALVRYYSACGAGGLAVAVHTTQFAIREPRYGLFKPVLEIAMEEMRRAGQKSAEPLLAIGGICGATAQAVAEAETLRGLGYHAGLLSLAALREASEPVLLAHCREVAAHLPVIGFYLQPAVGGRPLPFGFWRQFAELENVVAIKIAPFSRYQTLEVVRAVVESGRLDIALYTGNDDNIVADLLTPYRFRRGDGQMVERRIVGGLLGQWAVWTSAAVRLLRECHAVADAGGGIPVEMMRRAAEVTDANAALFDAANNFAGCIAGIHEVLRRQGLLEGTWCLDPGEGLSPGQAEEIERVCQAYPHLQDDAFVREHLDAWLSRG